MSLTKPRVLVLLALIGIPAIWYLTTAAYSPGSQESGEDVATVEDDLELEGLDTPPEGKQAWAALEQAEWFAEGADDPERVVYVFLDPQCPYCNLLWKASLPYLEEGLQVRNIVVSYLTPKSEPQAETILSAENPTEMHEHHQERYKEGGIEPGEATEEGQRTLAANNALFDELEIPATPAIYFKDENGEVDRVIGFPDLSMLAADVFRLPEQPQTDPAVTQYQ